MEGERPALGKTGEWLKLCNLRGRRKQGGGRNARKRRGPLLPSSPLPDASYAG